MTGIYRFNKSTRSQYLQNLRSGMRRGAAAKAVGITRETVYHHRKKHPEFAEEERQAEIEACELVEDKLYSMAIKGNIRAIEMWLSKRSPERWSKDPSNNLSSVKISRTPERTQEWILEQYSSPDYIAEYTRILFEMGLIPDPRVGDGSTGQNSE